MKFNVTFMGPEPIAHLRRDLMLLLQYALEDRGHEVCLSLQTIEPERINIIIGGYFLAPDQFPKIIATGAPVIHLNSEVIKNDMMNFNPKKVDFLGAYLPFLRYGLGVMETVIDNMGELDRYGLKSHFLRWAYHEKLADVPHQKDKDLDFYLFGMMSPRRQEMLKMLVTKGYKGTAHHSCPYYVRNSFIGRAKVQLNIIQADIYTHVNCYRIGYLANNGCAILSEKENDPADYLRYARICDRNTFTDAFAELITNDRWKKQAKESLAAYKQISIRPIMEEALEFFLGNARPQAAMSAS